MSHTTEFATNARTAWRGFTTIEAAEFLRSNLPDEAGWMVWVPEHPFVKRLILAGGAAEGAFGSWRWRRVPSAYPAVFYYVETAAPEEQKMWTGLVEVTAPDQRRFFLFSYLNAAGEIGRHYFVSISDDALLSDFSDALRHHLAPAGRIVVTVPAGEDIHIDDDVSEYLCLPAAMRADIERQSMGFFANEEGYRDMGIRHRRGLLFVGPPGTGKTMTIRHLIRHIHRQAPVSCFALRTHGYLSDDHLICLFTQARRSERAIVVIEDIERIASTDSPLRTALLSQMDGLAPNHGLLVLATTNHPDQLDAAISKRPSRFDRTWVFSLPDRSLRCDYLQKTLGTLGDDLVAAATERTSGWSFAFLNELRTTAVLLAMNGNAPLSVSHVEEALEVLGRQFKAAKNGYKDDGTTENVGFH